MVEEAGGGDFELDAFQREPDPRMHEAFDSALHSRRIIDDWAAVDAHDSVAYVPRSPRPPVSTCPAGRWP
ncbi:hypothetical protein [Streptomyces capitiformicae]|uniref:Uncharacterized protein n=1 Tax=Streptomyces capitiformicae TaxID=2014920 RepID=A0A919DAS1_9ACTN|nr:hypothetical protein [Streptomyces capitiformicae]GHE29857.1 hypothetical protein GCM10017771_45640 [Streptomyces capitiformicae]